MQGRIIISCSVGIENFGNLVEVELNDGKIKMMSQADALLNLTK